MKYREIVDHYPISDSHPFTVVVDLHDSLMSQFIKFVSNSPADFRLLAKRKTQPNEWLVHVGCSTDAARTRFDKAWS